LKAMTETALRASYVAAIDRIVRQITWQSQKQLAHTLSRPDIDLTMPQMHTLFAIRAARTCRMSELAEITQQSAGTLTGIVDRLIEEQLVGRVRDIDDRRVVQVTLTPRGEERAALVEQARREDMERMLRPFNLDQLQQFEGLMSLLLNGIHEIFNSHALAGHHSNGIHHSVEPVAHDRRS
jgi:DNA-binding MarR family transcriptional regulator